MVGDALTSADLARDAMLRERSRDAYWVQTLDDPANRAIRFYEENGFERAGVRGEAGRRLVVLQKELER